MKVLFLDIDGVLNSMQWFEASSKREMRRIKGATKANYREDVVAYGEHMLDPTSVEILNRIIDRTDGCKVVLSSSWRNTFGLEDVKAMLIRAGFYGDIIDKTPARVDNPTPRPYERGYEIDAWLKENALTATFAILDNGGDMAHLRDRLVQTNLLFGLTPYDAECVIFMLNEPNEVFRAMPIKKPIDKETL